MSEQTFRSKAWGQKRKAKQRKAIYTWRPWEKSTGPKSAEGKQRVSRNALKHGLRSAAGRAELKMLRNLLDGPALQGGHLKNLKKQSKKIKSRPA